MTCTYCTDKATIHTAPPLCEKHLDLALLTERLRDRGQPVTVESVTGLRAACLASHGTLTITEAEIGELLPGFLETVL